MKSPKVGTFLKKLRIHKFVLKIVMSYWKFHNKLKYREVHLIAIIWPTAYHIRSEVIEDIRKKYSITEIFEVVVPAENRKQFIIDLYAIDRASERKINSKIEPIVTSPDHFTFVKFTIPNPRLESHSNYNTWIRCKDVNDLKHEVRRKHSSKIPNYIYDLIIHSTEMTEQSTPVMELIVTHKGLIKG